MSRSETISIESTSNKARSQVGTMQAAVYQRYGGPEKLSIQQVPIPIPGENDVLIKVHCSTVNRTDCGFLRGKPFIVRFFSGLFKPTSTVLGCEFAGEVCAVGKDVNKFSVGQRVVGFKDDDYGFGGHAEYTVIPETGMLATTTSTCNYEELAPALEGAHYALNFFRAADIKAGHKVLVNGATGAIGSAAVQLLREIGAEVTGVCETQHMETIRELGATQVIDYTREDFTESSAQYDVVFDAVGKRTFGECRRILTDQGIYMSSELGPYCQNPLLALWTRRSKGQKVLFPIPMNLQSDAIYLAQLIDAGKFTPLVDRAYPLDKIVDAFTYVETGMKVGNVVVMMSAD